MQSLNLPTYSFSLKTENKTQLIFDPLRKKYVVLTPEEWVRQNFVQYLVRNKSFPASLIVIEKHFKFNQLSKRADILVYNRSGEAILMTECKSPDVKISQEVFDQIALYNIRFQVKYLIVTNGLKHYCCRMEVQNNRYVFLNNIPDFSEICG